MGLAYTQTGTPYYASPEVWEDKPYDSKSDIWSLGCVIYEMTTLKPPFTDTSMQGLFKKVMKGSYPPIKGYSNDLMSMIAQLLQVSPAKRPDCDQIMHLPAFSEHVPEDVEEEIHQLMMNTIKLPRNLKMLNLPASQYKGNKSQKSTNPSTKSNYHTKKELSPSSSKPDSIAYKPPIGKKKRTLPRTTPTQFSGLAQNPKRQYAPPASSYKANYSYNHGHSNRRSDKAIQKLYN